MRKAVDNRGLHTARGDRCRSGGARARARLTRRGGRGLTLRLLGLVVVGLAAFASAAAQERVGADVAALMQASAQAEPVYVTLAGAGERDGTAPADALPFAALAERLADLSRSTVVVFAPGEYPLTSALSLRAPDAGVLHLRGGRGVVFRGDFDFARPDSGTSGLRLHSGNIIIQGIHFENTRFCVRAENRAQISDVYIDSVTARDVHDCILVERGLSGPIEDWTISGLRVDGYYRVGVRLSGPNARRFHLSGLRLDGANSADVHFCWKGGLQLYEGVSTVRVANARIVNNVGDCADYQQGDGIEADDTGGAPRDIEIRSAFVANSGDADLDMKADDVRLYDVTSAGGAGTYYNFKFWNYPNYSCQRCVGANANWFHIILVNATARFDRAQFYSDDPVPPCDLRHTDGGRARLLLQEVRMEASPEQFADCEVEDADAVLLGEIPPNLRQGDPLAAPPAAPVLQPAE